MWPHHGKVILEAYRFRQKEAVVRNRGHLYGTAGWMRLLYFVWNATKN